MKPKFIFLKITFSPKINFHFRYELEFTSKKFFPLQTKKDTMDKLRSSTPPSASTSQKSPEAVHLEHATVSQWLDKNPEFLSAYLNKLKQQGRLSVSNDNNKNFPLNMNSHHSHRERSLTSNLSKVKNINSNLSEHSDFQITFGSNTDPFQYYSTTNVPKNASDSFNATKMPARTSHLFNICTSSRADSNVLVVGGLPSHDFLQQRINTRKNFKQLSLYEKMYTLVKTLYQSLDLKLTCKKILNTVNMLLDADRCSLFLVTDDLNDETSENEELEGVKKCLISVIFDAQSSENDSQNELTYEKIKIPFGVGIAGVVAESGKPLNIPNAYDDKRFNPNIDIQTGYKTKSILCLPILNAHGECIAVAEALNKLNDNGDEESYDVSTSPPEKMACNNIEKKLSFTKEDEEVTKSFT